MNPVGGCGASGGPATIVRVDQFEVVVAAGTLRAGAGEVVPFRHRWTPDGVTVQAAFTGAHLLHLAVAGCVLNDVFREAEKNAVDIRGVRVTASGDFQAGTWVSTGIRYSVEVDSPASAEVLQELIATVDVVAEIPKAIRVGAEVVNAGPSQGTPHSQQG